MSLNSTRFRNWVNQKMGQKSLLEEQIEDARIEHKEKQEEYDDLTKARWLLAEASKLTQVKIRGYMESLVTMAINAVFEHRDLKFLVDFDIKRNKSECFLRVQEGDWEPYIPKEDEGGGIIDVISFALRVVLWSLEEPRSRALFYLDEPGKWVGRELVDRFGQMIREVSEKLKIQIIMNTHEEELAVIGDRKFFTEHKDGMSSVVQAELMDNRTPVEKVIKKRKRLG